VSAQRRGCRIEAEREQSETRIDIEEDGFPASDPP
jgi:hypothetical protein